MSNYIATVINTGNSVALRVPKQYAVEARLIPGEKVQLNLPRRYKVQDRAKINRIISELRDMNAYESIQNPTEWQREVRQDRKLPGRQ